MTAIISNIYDTDRTQRPVRLRFQNGELAEDADTALSGGIYMDEDELPRKRAVIASDNLIYSGFAAPDNVYHTYLAVKNKKTNKIKLIAIDNAMLKPEPPKTRELLDSTMMETNTNALTELNKEFGSKKSKRVTEEISRLQVNVNNVKDQLEQTIANLEINEAILTDDAPTSDIVPPINKKAQTVEEVYKLERLVPAEVLNSLRKQAKLLMQGENETIKTCDYVERLIRHQQGKNVEPEMAERTMIILLVIDALINIVKTTAKDIGMKAFKVQAHSSSLSEYVLNHFTVMAGNKRTRPPMFKDKTCMYIVALHLFINNSFKILNIDQIGVELGVKQKIGEFCKMLSLYVTTARGAPAVASLKLPLPAPYVKSPSKRQSRK